MMSSLSEFGRIARALARNPLGIVALFIFLVYAIAALVMTMAVSHISEAQTWVFIIFFVAFPVLVLFSFLWLVCKHHKKLYAPRDFRNDEAFLQSAGLEEQRRRLHTAAQSLVSSGGDRGGSGSALPQAADIRRKIFSAETLVFRKIEIEVGEPVRREMVWIRGDRTYHLDGAVVKDDALQIAITVKYTVQTVSGDLVNQAVREWGTLAAGAPFRVILVFVIDYVSRKEFESETRKIGTIARASGLTDLEVRCHGFSDLEQELGI